MIYAGEIAALATAVLWSASAMFFTSASHRIGSFSMSHFRLAFGVVLICVMQLAVNGTIFPSGVSSYSIQMLVISGICGFFISDALLFQSYVDIGPRLGVLVNNTYPFLASFLAYLFLNEVLSKTTWLGMVITTAGVLVVLLEKKGLLKHLHHIENRRFARGLLFGFLAGMFQAVSITFSKVALGGEGHADPLTATLIRCTAGFLCYLTVTIFRGRVGYVFSKRSNTRAMWLIAGGAVVGPSVGVWMSMIAVQKAPLGIAATLMSLMPIAIIPMTAIFYKERTSWRALVGAVLAFIGVAILFNS